MADKTNQPGKGSPDVWKVILVTPQAGWTSLLVAGMVQ
jgi:hypothetical protein